MFFKVESFSPLIRLLLRKIHLPPKGKALQGETMNNTVLKTYDILKLISKHKDGLSLAQIVKALDLPKSTVFNIVHTLENVGLLSCEGTGAPTYRLGIEALKIGLSYMNESTLDSVARPILSRLSRETEETVCLSVRSGEADVVYVMHLLSDLEYQSKYSIGDVRPFLSLAMGKAMLSVLPEEETRRIITPEMFAECSISSVTDMDSLLVYLEETRRLGYAVESTEENVMFACPVAAPILDIDGHLAAAISIVIMRDPANPERVAEMGKKVHRAALDISRRLGFMGKDLYE